MPGRSGRTRRFRAYRSIRSTRDARTHLPSWVFGKERARYDPDEGATVPQGEGVMSIDDFGFPDEGNNR